MAASQASDRVAGRKGGWLCFQDSRGETHAQGRVKSRLTGEEVPDLLDEEPCAPDILLHLGAAGAHLGLQALRI